MALPSCRIYEALLLALLVICELRAETARDDAKVCNAKSTSVHKEIRYWRKHCTDGQKRKAGKSNLIVNKNSIPDGQIQCVRTQPSEYSSTPGPYSRKRENTPTSVSDSASSAKTSPTEIGKFTTTLSSLSEKTQSIRPVTQQSEPSTYATTTTIKDYTSARTTPLHDAASVQTKISSDPSSDPSTRTFQIETKFITTISMVSEKTQPFTSITQRQRDEPSTYTTESAAKEETGEWTTPVSMIDTAIVQTNAPPELNETFTRTNVAVGSSISVIVIIIVSISIAIIICRKKRQLASRRQEQGTGTELENFMFST